MAFTRTLSARSCSIDRPRSCDNKTIHQKRAPYAPLVILRIAIERVSIRKTPQAVNISSRDHPVRHSVRWPTRACRLTGGARVECSPGQVSRRLVSERMSGARARPLLASRQDGHSRKCENSPSHVMVVRSRSENEHEGGSSWPRVSKSEAAPHITGAYSPSSGSLLFLQRSSFPLHPEGPKSHLVRLLRPISR